MRIAIIDDEYPSRNELKYLISEYMPQAVIDEADSGNKAIELFNENVYDAAFVDIHLGDMIGTSLFVLLKKKQPGIELIFATAYDSYAVKAFEMNAADYIMKPFDPSRIEKCLQKITGLSAPQIITSLPENKISISAGKKMIVLTIDEIAYIESKGHQCIIYTKEKEYFSNLSLSYYEHRLMGAQFFRTHKSILVNLQYIKELSPWTNGAFNIKLNGFETCLPVSRSQVKLLKQIFK